MKSCLIKSSNVYRCLLFFICCLILMVFFIIHASASIDGEDKIKIENGRVWGQIKGLGRQDVLKILAQKAGIEIIGLEHVTGIIQDIKFDNLSIENAISKIAQDRVVISHKEGIKGGDFSIKKIIILPDTTKGKDTAIPQIQISTEKEAPPQKIMPPKKEIPIPHTLPPQTHAPSQTPTPQPQAQQISTPQLPPPQLPPSQPRTPETHTEDGAPDKPLPSHTEKVQPLPAKKEIIAVKSIENTDKDLGLDYFKKKRWDLAIKNFKKYLEMNPSDTQIEKKVEEANGYINQAIALYKAGRLEQEKWNLEGAYQYYKKAYDIYPLLYDCWERMQSIKNGL
ncbi:MAG: hypothetical protein ACMUJM_21635 [bacterium]